MTGEYTHMAEYPYEGSRQNIIKWTDSCIAALAGLSIGIAVGLFIGNSVKDGIGAGVFLPGVSNRIIKDGDPTVSDIIMDTIKSENIREYLRDLSELPHLAGTDADFRQANELRDFWRQEGMDEVYVTPYDVLLSYPNVTDDDMMNRIELLNATGGIVYQSPLREAILHQSDNKSGVVPPFNAYSAPGDVTAGRLVYVNYGRLEDYRWLKNNTSVNVSGAIVIVRYQNVFRGDKVKLAAANGAVGVILYSDPAEVVPSGSSSKLYPDGWWLPPSGVQRGTVGRMSGDPLTPGYPATETAYRYSENSSEAQLPTIPVHPIGYGAAEVFLREMTGDEVPDHWKGGLNITYRLGGQLKTNGRKIRIFISTQSYMRRIYNVFGVIHGSVEPDRYVLMGNHRDAWVFGAIDPSSATAVMKEVSRVMGNLVKQGRWRPRRTIIFCSWDAEEYGVIGSYEWVEQYVKNLAARSVAYINIDMAVTGNLSFVPTGTPLIFTATYEATKKVANPDPDDLREGLRTVYDKWLRTYPSPGQSKPLFGMLGSTSDHAPFVQLVGVPCVMLSYVGNLTVYNLYPTYHSRYDTFRVIDDFIDKGFKTHRAVGQVAAEMTRNLADSLIVPFNVNDFSQQLQILVEVLDNEYGQFLRSHGVHFDWLQEAANNFSAEAVEFQTRVDSVDMNNPFSIRRINDQLMLLERAFIDPAGLPGRPQARHVLYSNLDVDTYQGTTFPGLMDTLLKLTSVPEQEAEELWEVVKHHFSVVIYTIQSAQSTLRDVTSFMPDSKESVVK
ncbi:N-acetylated-alpha-linked acidic dipeptidase 2-like [Pecten maximus]|uniref:N-acetylated-alpha-linked acidic dipeptidase 2-like n=1 Tax=Pecten maximus TaxID=6579 RepID=UPI001458961F|nr:N-acetylated-alpha-linked acidic dipeptidase 2-like [Pecten maximus]